MFPVWNRNRMKRKKQTSGLSGRRAPTRYRPLLEALEDRLIPALHIWRGAVSSLWSDGRNWDGGAPTGDPEPYVAFPDGSSPHPSTINDIVGLRVSKIGLFGDSYTLRGNPITLIVETLIWQAPIHGGNNTIGL